MTVITAKNPSGKEVFFYEDKHQYVTREGRILTSVTAFVHSFFPVFEKERISREQARKRGRRQQDILDEWERNAREAGNTGTYVHKFCECRMKETPFSKRHFETEREVALLLTAERACEVIKKSYRFVEAEKIVFSTELNLAGTIDLLLYDEETRSLVLLDWKTNKELKTSNPWQNGLAPISHLESCAVNQYVLQLSTYRYILQKENYYPDFPDCRLQIVHLRPEGYERIAVSCLLKEVEEMLSWA